MARPGDEADHEMMDIGNETTVMNESQWEGVKRNMVDGLKRNLMCEFATPVKTVARTSTVIPKQEIAADSDNMKVYLRIRPFTDNEVNKGENQVSKVVTCSGIYCSTSLHWSYTLSI